MKKVFISIISLFLCLGLNGCGKQEGINSENLVTSIDDIQGFWYDEETHMLMGFQDDVYIICSFGTGISILGAFEVNSNVVTLYSDEYSDKKFNSFNSAEINNDVLTLKNDNGTTEWERIEKSDVERLLLEFGY